MEGNGNINTTQTVCGLCGHEMPYKSSPGRFSKHLERRHYKEYSDDNFEFLEDNSEFERQQIGIDISNTFEKDGSERQKNEYRLSYECPKSKTETDIVYPSWNGDTLFPPIKRTDNPSKAWSFGGFRTGQKGDLIKSVMVCGLCGLEMIYNYSPS